MGFWIGVRISNTSGKLRRAMAWDYTPPKYREFSGE